MFYNETLRIDAIFDECKDGPSNVSHCNGIRFGSAQRICTIWPGGRKFFARRVFLLGQRNQQRGSQLRTRWEEDPYTAQDHHRKFSILPIALGMAIPVAFIAGAAITNFMGMSQEGPEATVAQSGGGVDGALWTVDEQRRCAAAVETARADIAGLRQQLEMLQSRVITVTREKVEAEQKAALALAEKAAVAPAVTMNASLAAEPPASVNASGNAVSAPALPPEQAPASSSFTAVSGSQPASAAAQPITDTNVVDEPEPNSSSEVTAAVTETEPETSAAAKRPLSPRSALAVSDAVSSAAGLDVLSEPERRDLEASLVRGECVSDSLSDAFNSHVPVVPLRDLIRKLDSEC